MSSTTTHDASIETLKRQFKEALSLLESGRSSESSPLEQFKNVVVRDKDERSARWHELGLTAIRQGQVAVVMLAGGQGTRLGSSQPKGMYRIGLPSGKSLFAVHADRLHALCSLANKLHRCVCSSSFSSSSDSSNASCDSSQTSDCVSENCSCRRQSSIAWYIMTSDATDAATRQYFDENDYFGFDKQSVRFFVQRSQPCLTRDAEMLPIDGGGGVARAPNGNGGVYEALGESGCVDDMRKRGVEAVFVTGVDNVLLRIADPQFVGALLEQRADAAAKVVRKVEPTERVGVLGVRDGRTAVVEYSELSGQDARRRDESGALVYSAANICIHAFRIDFLAEQAERSGRRLPYHLAHKAIAVYDAASGTLTAPDAPNGYKLERFVFDVFPYAKRMLAMFVERNDEFAPLKNAPGSPSDTPKACAGALHALHRRWLRAHTNIDVADQCPVEISERVSYAGENLDSLDLSAYDFQSTEFQYIH
jgi:UDP-N-acetylglucosamine/UDP-N-acetylgalactosamine diphosphorylase